MGRRVPPFTDRCASPFITNLPQDDASLGVAVHRQAHAVHLVHLLLLVHVGGEGQQVILVDALRGEAGMTSQ